MKLYNNKYKKIKTRTTLVSAFAALLLEVFYAIVESIPTIQLIQISGILFLLGTGILYYKKKISIEYFFIITTYSIIANILLSMNKYYADYKEAFLVDTIYFLLLLPLVGFLGKRIHSIILAIIYNAFLLFYTYKINNNYLYQSYIINAVVLLAYAAMIYIIIGFFEKAQSSNQEMIAEIKQKNLHLNTQTKNLTVANNTIGNQKKELEKINATKDKLFSIIAHDIKGPMNTILGFTEILKELYSDLDEETRLDYIKRIDSSSSNLFNMMNRLLNWSKTQLGNFTPNPRSIKLMDVYHLVLENLSSVINEKNIKLNFEGNLSAKAWVDYNMVEIVFRNIVNNAIKFSNMDGMLDIKIINKNQFIETQVIDYGIGITEEEITRILDPYDFYSKKGTLEENGNGLGLSIVIEMIKQNNGAIHINSTPGLNTNVSFILPSSPPNI